MAKQALSIDDRLAIVQQAVADYGEAGGAYLVTETETETFIVLLGVALDENGRLGLGDQLEEATHCPECEGELDAVEVPDADPDVADVFFDCPLCGWRDTRPIWGRLVASSVTWNGSNKKG